MKRHSLFLLVISVLAGAFSLPAYSQTATVHGLCRDDKGNPITDAQVTWHNDDNGRTFKLKTNKKGEYFSLGIDPGTYTVTLIGKDGKELDHVSKYKVGVDEVDLPFDLKQSQEQAVQQTAKEKGITPEEVKEKQEQNNKAVAYNARVKVVNEIMKAATADEQANPPNYDGAIAKLNEATQQAPDEDLVWFRLGGAYLESAKSQSDAGEKTKRNTEAYNDIQKAIDIYKSRNGAAPANGQPAAKPQGGKPVDPAAESEKLGAYYDNFGAAAARVGKNDEAVNAYKQAAEIDPKHASHYQLNLGIALMNGGNTKDAAEAFDKAIAADPNNALPYFFKGQSLFAGVSMDSSGKMVAPPGTQESLNKYLELQPDGPYSQSAKDMLSALGTKVETSYGTKKKK